MDRTYDAIVVGMGAMGSAACYHLARRGARVLGLEQFGIPHTLGSAHGESRMIRLCYYEHSDYVPLLKRAYELWQELEEEAGRTLLHITGGIYMGDPNGEFIAGTRRAAEQFHLPHERLSRHELRARFPLFHVPEGHVGIYEPNAGFLLPEDAVSVHAGVAIEHGAEVRVYEPVIDWQATDQGVRIRTSQNTYRAQRVIFAAGAWSERLAGDLGVELRVTRQVMGWVRPKRPELFELGRFPVWAVANPDGSLHYGFPILPGRMGLKTAHHVQGRPTTADTVDRIPQPEDEDDFRPALRKALPDADGSLLCMLICMYTNTPDSHFIIDRHPADERVIVAAGFSGHGFKFASVMGEVLADLTLDGETRHPIQFLSLRRFVGAGRRIAGPAATPRR